MNTSFQIVYAADEGDPGTVHRLYREEAAAMSRAGIPAATACSPEASELMYRGFYVPTPEAYPADPRYINRYQHQQDYLLLSHYYPPIADLSIETFFAAELEEHVADQIRQRGWERAFIKGDRVALEHIEEGKSVWPLTSFSEMTRLYAEMGIHGPYAIRQYVEKELIEQEERYWVLNGNIYHRHNRVPEVVQEAARRLNKLGSRYYTIDATPQFVVEVNPGEASDRHAVNSAELFASWIKQEFAP